jgi:hypothetical protein
MVELSGGGRYIVFETKGTTNTEFLGGTHEPTTTAGKLRFTTVVERLGLSELKYAVISDMADANGVLPDATTFRKCGTC